MAVQKRPSRIVELDLEATAELPVIDFDTAETVDALAVPESAIGTDVFPTPVVPAGVADLANSLREVEARLQRKSERVRTLESGLAAAKSQIEELQLQLEQTRLGGAERESSLRAELAAAAQREADLQRVFNAQQHNLVEARAQLQTQHAALTESQQQAQHRATVQRQHQDDLLALRRRCEHQHEALSTWLGFRAVSESLLAESEARLDGIDTQHVAALHAAQLQSSQLQEGLAAARQEAAAQVAALENSLREAGEAQQATSAQLLAAADRVSQLTAELATSQVSAARTEQQLAELRAVEEKARAGAAKFDEQVAQIARLEAEFAAASGRLRDAEAQIRSAGERVQRLESEAHASAALLGNLQKNMQRLGRDDTGNHLTLQGAIGEVVLRVLIRQEGGSDVVYPLGRRTTIGRTPDNDIQVDTTFISRHHAVLLSNPDSCIVEDLASTNGVLVNGRRVMRQTLHDGDAVTVGKTEFRYQQRS